MSKRVLAMALAILAFFIFVASPFEQAANAVVGVDDAIIAIIIAALAALGITFVTTAAFQSTQDYVGDLMQEYATENNTTVAAQLMGTQVGSNKLGQILVNNRFVLYLQGFAAWIKAKFSLQNNEINNLVVPGSTIGGLVAYSLPFEIMNQVWGRRWDLFVGNDAYLIWGSASNNGTLNPRFYSEYAGTVQRVTVYPDGTVGSTRNYELTYNAQIGLYTAEDTTGFGIQDYPQLQTVTYYSNDYLNSLEDAVIDQNNIGIDIVTGNITLPFDDSNYTEGDGAVIDVGADWGDTYPEITEGVIPGEFSDGKEGDAAIEYEGEQTVQDQVEDTPAQQVSQNVNEYRSPGLQDVFPFCIPFDIYAFFECLAAEPEAPSFVWRFYIPGICDEDIEIDLAEFDSAARILRTMELLLFIVGLAFVTRDKFLRG